MSLKKHENPTRSSDITLKPLHRGVYAVDPNSVLYLQKRTKKKNVYTKNDLKFTTGKKGSSWLVDSAPS